MDKENFQNLKNQVWTTRVSRVNAEKRLVKKELFFQGINIYYSCVTIIFSILSLITENNILSLITVLMTISLLIVILYLNGQKYLERAREYRKNYTALQKLEFCLNHLNESQDKEICEIEKEYCDLLDSNSNHISYDYYCTVFGSSTEYKKARWKNIRSKYYWGTFWRVIIKALIIALPIALPIVPFLICGVI